MSLVNTEITQGVEVRQVTRRSNLDKQHTCNTLCNPSLRFWKELIFQLSPHVMSSMNGKGGVISMIIVVSLLVAIMKDQVEQLNKIRVVATAIYRSY